MSKKKKHEEHENHERWLVSYADFITLLFAFFVVLYSVSRVDVKKAEQASQSIRWAMHSEGRGSMSPPIVSSPLAQQAGSSSFGKQGPEPQRDVKLLDNLRKRIDTALRRVLLEQQDTKSVAVVIENGRLTIRLAAANFFDAGNSALRPDSLVVIDTIGAELQSLERPVRIEGHTDDLPISSSRYQNNWELSAARAASVVSYLERAHHIPPVHLTAAGMGSARPLVPNDTPERRELNRRIEIAVEVFPDDRLTPLIR